MTKGRGKEGRKKETQGRTSDEWEGRKVRIEERKGEPIKGRREERKWIRKREGEEGDRKEKIGGRGLLSLYFAVRLLQMRLGR